MIKIIGINHKMHDDVSTTFSKPEASVLSYLFNKP